MLLFIVLPVVNERYEIHPVHVFHLPVINHKLAEQSLKDCLIRQLNKDQIFIIIADKALRVSFYSFKDDITLSCPSIRGLNRMLDIFNKFAAEHYLIFNSKKSLEIKYGNEVNDTE